MTTPSDASQAVEPATCRHCRRLLVGKAYYLGGCAYIPDAQGRPGKRAPVNYYGGFVCSEQCDRATALELERSMPGHGYSQKSLGSDAARRVASNWRD